MADVCFRRLQAGPVCAHLWTLRFEGSGFTIDPTASHGRGQQLSNPHFRFFVVAFAEVVIAHAPCRIDEVERRPVVIAKPTPDRAVVVDGDRVRNASLLRSLSNVVDVFLETEFGGVHANDDQPLLTVPGGPRANIRRRATTPSLLRARSSSTSCAVIGSPRARPLPGAAAAPKPRSARLCRASCSREASNTPVPSNSAELGRPLPGKR